MSFPTLYVQAGPYGSGKSSSYDFYVPKTVPFINTDEISAKIKSKYSYLSNTQEQANAEATNLFNGYIQAKESYGFETNLHDVETWKFIERHKIWDYSIRMNFFTVDNLDVLNERIKIRQQDGGHFIRPDIVEARYLAGHKLLEHYIDIPDVLNIIDSSSLDQQRPVLSIRKGVIFEQAKDFPEHLTPLVESIQKKEKETKQIRPTIEEIKKEYKKRGDDKGFSF